MEEEIIYLICDCGNDKFHIGTNEEYAMCSKCRTVYNLKGEKVEIEQVKGETVYISR